MSMNIAVFGGSFNPPHRAHLNIAREFSEKLCLDRMFIIPTFLAPHKSTAEYASAEDRMEMCRLLFSEKCFTVSDMEIKRQGKSYTVDTLTLLEKEFPGAKIYLIIGSDMLFYFDKWYRYEDILAKCTLCVMTRENETGKEEMLRYARDVLGLCENDIIISSSGAYEMSSTQIREKIRADEDVSEYLTEEVENYIREKRLYL